MKRNKLNSVWKEYCFILQDELEDTKGAIRICISKKNRQHNGQKIPKGQSESVYQRRTNNTMAKKKTYKRRKQRSTKHSYKTKDRVTRTPLKTGGEHRCSGRVGSSYCTSDTRRVNLVTTR